MSPSVPPDFLKNIPSEFGIKRGLDFLQLTFNDFRNLMQKHPDINPNTCGKYMFYLLKIYNYMCLNESQMYIPLGDEMSTTGFVLALDQNIKELILFFEEIDVKQKTGEGASIYMKRDGAAAVLWACSTCDALLASENVEKIEEYYNEQNDLVSATSLLSANNKETISIDSFKKLIRNGCEYATRASVMLNIYAQVPARDDLQLQIMNLSFISPSWDEKRDGTIEEFIFRTFGTTAANYLLVDFRGSPEEWSSWVVIGSSKTFGKGRSTPIYAIDNELTVEIKAYLDKEKKKIDRFGAWLFDGFKNSKRVRDYLKQIGLKNASINTLRRMHTMEALHSNDPVKVVKTARELGHAILTSARYRAKILDPKYILYSPPISPVKL